MHSNKTFIVTGVSSGIGAETCRVLQEQGARVIGVDRNPSDKADQFIQADLSNRDSIDVLINTLPDGAHGLANIAGLPPTLPAADVLKVNMIGLRYLTLGLVKKLSDDASIVSLASLAGSRWQESVEQIKATLALDFDSDIEKFCQTEKLDDEARSYFLSKEALVVWTMQNRWTWRDRGINMNTISPAAVDTPILKDFMSTLGARAQEGARVMDRPGAPSDIAPVVSFALSDNAKWFRGANFTSDGGMSSHVLCAAHQL